MLYINYGVPKSGSTLTFEMTYKLLELAGHKQFKLSAEIRSDRTGREHYTNSVRDWTPAVVAALEAASPADAILLLRTHHPSSEAIAELIARGLAKHMVGLRDPRDIALSMLDVATRLSDWGKAHKIVQRGELESTLRSIDINVLQSTSWADIPGALILDYEQTAFSHELTLDAICEQLGLPPSRHLYPHVFEAATDRLEPKKNVARPYRHRREMSPRDQQMFLDRYADYYARFFPNAVVAVEEDDEELAAAVARRQNEQRQKVLERKGRLDRRADRQRHAAGTKAKGKAKRVLRPVRAGTKDERRQQRDDEKRLRLAAKNGSDPGAAKQQRRLKKEAKQGVARLDGASAKEQRRYVREAEKRIRNEQQAGRRANKAGNTAMSETDGARPRA